MGDEAYYWIWGQHPSWSYFDHPPLDAWLQSVVAALFGWSPFSLRLLTWLSFGGILAIFWAWSRQLGTQNPAFFLWRTAAVFLTVPVIALFTTPAFHDHLLVFFCIASIYCFWRFVVAREEGGPWIRHLYAAGLLLGLATLSKYNGALLGLGYVAFFALRPSLWSVLRTPHPYLAALLAVGLQAPVVYWNVTEGFASARYHLLERPSHWGYPDFGPFPALVLQNLFGAGPILALAAILQPGWALEGRSRVLRDLALTVAAASSIVVAIIAAYVQVLLHWNIVAYAALALVGAFALARAWLFWPHALITIFLATSMTANYAIGPNTVPGFTDPGSPANFGWDQVATAVADARRQHPEAFLAATKYNYAAQLSFALHSLDVTAINPLRSQYDFWWSPAAHQGEDAIIVADRTNGIELSSPRFRAVTKLADVPVTRQGKQIWSFEIYLGEGYDGRTYDGSAP